MAKYYYSKKPLKGLGVGAFLNEVKLREAEIAKAPDSLPNPVYNANRLAAKLHPGVQFGVIESVTDRGGIIVYIIAPDAEMGMRELAYFRAGQYVSVALDIGQARLCKPYTIASSPKAALGETGNRYELAIEPSAKGYASKYIPENWKPGTKLIFSGPLGNYYYVGLRDAKHVVALAGGSGVTPFLSMARAIADGIEDFRLTVLLGNRTLAGAKLADELAEAAARSKGKVKLVHVLSDERVKGCEYGLITAELVKKYAGEGDYSVFVCGPKAMYAYEREELKKLGLPRRRLRFELSGEYGDPARDPAYPKGTAGKSFAVKVFIRGEETRLTCRADQTLLTAMESAGIRVPADCRSGRCGWCHSRLISGEVFVPEESDGRRLADKKFGWVHPCVTYPLSDIEIEVFTMLC